MPGAGGRSQMRRAESFPMVGKKFSNGWKKSFQWLENLAVFSNGWKIFFQWLENSEGGAS
jgi:hypothetical protein